MDFAFMMSFAVIGIAIAVIERKETMTYGRSERRASSYEEDVERAKTYAEYHQHSNPHIDGTITALAVVGVAVRYFVADAGGEACFRSFESNGKVLPDGETVSVHVSASFNADRYDIGENAARTMIDRLRAEGVVASAQLQKA